MQDITGCRLNVVDIREQDGALERLLGVFPGARVVDRRHDPHLGYRAIHLIPVLDGRQVEIQIRTLWQDLWANLSESMADKVGSGLKYGEPAVGNLPYERTAQMLARTSQLVAILEDSEVGRELFAEDMFETPVGRLTAMNGAFVSILTLAMEEIS